MDETSKSESVMQLADQLIAVTPTENATANENNNKEIKMADTTTRNIFNANPSEGMGDSVQEV